jgi:hypothetical protein
MLEKALGTRCAKLLFAAACQHCHGLGAVQQGPRDFHGTLCLWRSLPGNTDLAADASVPIRWDQQHRPLNFKQGDREGFPFIDRRLPARSPKDKEVSGECVGMKGSAGVGGEVDEARRTVAVKMIPGVDGAA